MTNQRKDWHWKLATDLCRRFGLIATEKLNLDGMKRLWGRKVSDLAFGQFVEILKFKCFKHHRDFRQAGQWTPTTKPCSDCGYHNKELTLSDRQWTCPECGSHHDRDINAAINILRAACDPSMDVERQSDGGLFEKAAVARKHRFPLPLGSGCLDCAFLFTDNYI